MTGKKKAPISATPSNAPSITMNIAPVSPVALLIDGENVIIPDLIAYVLVEAGKMGGVTTRQVYGNWNAASIQSWKKYTAHYGLEQRGDSSGRNATDIALTIGAMDLLYSGIKHFCLVASDSDYVPLVRRLRQDKCQVLVIGKTDISAALKEACNTFLCIDQLLPKSAPPSPSSKSQSPTKSSRIPALTSLEIPAVVSAFIAAYQAATGENKTEWISLSALGTTLWELYPDFQTTYSNKKLSTLLKEHPIFFELRQMPVGKGETTEVRLLKRHKHYN